MVNWNIPEYDVLKESEIFENNLTSAFYDPKYDEKVEIETNGQWI